MQIWQPTEVMVTVSAGQGLGMWPVRSTTLHSPQRLRKCKAMCIVFLGKVDVAFEFKPIKLFMEEKPLASDGHFAHTT